MNVFRVDGMLVFFLFGVAFTISAQAGVNKVASISVDYDLWRDINDHAISTVHLLSCNQVTSRALKRHTQFANVTCSLRSDGTPVPSAQNLSVVLIGNPQLVVIDTSTCPLKHCSLSFIFEVLAFCSSNGVPYVGAIDSVREQFTFYDVRTKVITEYNPNTSKAQNTFETVYNERRWGDAGDGSGAGSSLEASRSARSVLLRVIKEYGISSMVDAPCGSMAWMPTVLTQLASDNLAIQYVGLDVSCSVVNVHSLRFTRRKNWRFFCADVCHQALPQKFDLVFSRDALQHVPIEYAFAFLSNVKKSKAKFLLVGSYLNSTKPNVDINIGDYYDIDLTKPPFEVLPAPIQVFQETTISPGEPTKYLLLYRVDNLSWSGQ